MKRKYYITIVELKSGTQQNLIREEDIVDETIDKHLGGWGNLYGSSSSNRNVDNLNFQQSGTTRDGSKMFSILCCAEEEV